MSAADDDLLVQMTEDLLEDEKTEMSADDLLVAETERLLAIQVEQALSDSGTTSTSSKATRKATGGRTNRTKEGPSACSFLASIVSPVVAALASTNSNTCGFMLACLVGIPLPFVALLLFVTMAIFFGCNLLSGADVPSLPCTTRLRLSVCVGTSVCLLGFGLVGNTVGAFAVGLFATMPGFSRSSEWAGGLAGCGAAKLILGTLVAWCGGFMFSMGQSLSVASWGVVAAAGVACFVTGLCARSLAVQHDTSAVLLCCREAVWLCLPASIACGVSGYLGHMGEILLTWQLAVVAFFFVVNMLYVVDFSSFKLTSLSANMQYLFGLGEVCTSVIYGGFVFKESNSIISLLGLGLMLAGKTLSDHEHARLKSERTESGGQGLTFDIIFTGYVMTMFIVGAVLVDFEDLTAAIA